MFNKSKTCHVTCNIFPPLEELKLSNYNLYGVIKYKALKEDLLHNRNLIGLTSEYYTFIRQTCSVLNVLIQYLLIRD